MPLELAFRYNTVFLIPLEIISSFCYFIYFMYYCFIWYALCNFTDEMKEHYFPNFHKLDAFLKMVHHILLFIPFTMIFIDYDNGYDYMIVFVLIRISSYIYLLDYLRKLKQKLAWFNIIRIIEVIFHFIIISHIFGSIFIDIARYSTNNWIEIYYSKATYEEKTNFSIYLNALYWAVMSLSHATLGDIVSMSNVDQVYNSFVCLFGWFISVMLFGNISSLVSEFASKLRSKLLDSYNTVIDFIKKKRVDTAFNRQVNDYFNYLWQSNKGNIDSEIIRQLPIGIMADIQIYRFNSAVENSQIFKDMDGNINCQLAKTLFRLMEVEFYLIGDSVIKLGEKSFDIFIILEGEVDVINLKGSKAIATLKTGDHFGEANILLNTSIRTASVIAAKICQIGVISKENAERLFTAYPEWKDNLTDIAHRRVSNLFNAPNISDVNNSVLKLNEKLEENPQVFKRYTKRAEKLMAPKIIDLLKNTQENKWFRMSVIHLLLIVYSIFAIPIEIAFDYPVASYLLYLEGIIIVESFFFFLITCKYSIMIKARKELEYKDIIKFYYQSFLLQDIIAFSPFNLIFPVTGITHPRSLIIILRMLRLFSVIRIPSLLQKIEIFSRPFASIIGPLKAVFFLAMIMHWSSCFWYFIISTQTKSYTWIDAEGLNSVGIAVSVKWTYSIYYVMNLATGTGYSNTYPVTLLEKWLTIILILFGNIVFAVAFGLIASLISTIHFRVNNLLDKLRKVFNVLNKSDIPHRIVSRLEAYYAFNDSLVQTFGSLDCKILHNHLPKNIVNKITYECNKHILKKMPFFGEDEFLEMTERISLYMVPRIYLPNDYIIYKNDIGEEMYFIILGSVNILSSDNNKIVKILGKGDYVGEVALLFDAKRICSVVANSLSLLYLLGKNEFREVIKDYPKALEIMTQESNKRKAEAIVILENQKRNILETIPENPDEDNNREHFVNTLNLYSAISNPFFGGGSEKNMTALTGMDNVKSELVRDSYANGGKQARLYKRRPNINRPEERRFSQESLGKEIVLSSFSKMKMQWIVEEN